MKRITHKERIIELMKAGLSSKEIISTVGCHFTYGYRVIEEEKLRSGLEPAGNPKLKSLEARVKNLEKIVASLAAMKRFGGSGATSPQESSEVRLQRLLAGSERRSQTNEQ